MLNEHQGRHGLHQQVPKYKKTQIPIQKYWHLSRSLSHDEQSVNSHNSLITNVQKYVKIRKYISRQEAK